MGGFNWHSQDENLKWETKTSFWASQRAHMHSMNLPCLERRHSLLGNGARAPFFLLLTLTHARAMYFLIFLLKRQHDFLW